MGTRLDETQIADAVRLRVCEHKDWKDIASDIGCHYQTVLRARQTDEWERVALEVIKEIKAEAFPVAWQGLLGAAAKGDVGACREILDRVDNVVEQTLNVKHAGEIEIKDNEYAALLAELAGISTDGTPHQGGGDAKT